MQRRSSRTVSQKGVKLKYSPTWSSSTTICYLLPFGHTTRWAPALNKPAGRYACHSLFTASVNMYLSHRAACCSVYLPLLFTGNQMTAMRKMIGREIIREPGQCGVSLQPIIITRGQSESPSLVDSWGGVGPAQGLAYSYPISMHTLQSEVSSLLGNT